MSDICILIDFWKKTPSVRALIHQGFSFPDSAEIRKAIKDFPAPQRREAKKILTEIYLSLENLRSSLKGEHQQIFDSISEAQKRRMALISYNKTSLRDRRR